MTTDRRFPWSRWIANFRKPVRPIRARHTARPCLEALEDRLVLDGPGGGGGAPPPPPPLQVINTNDAGAGSLRQAIIDANNNAGPDTITVAIPGAGPHTITLVNALPTITEGVTIDATTQAGWAGDPIVELNGNNAANIGFDVNTSGVTITGWVINRFLGNGIKLNNTANPGAGNHVIQGNFIGTDLTGNQTANAGNGGSGIEVLSSDNYIGGPAWLGNVISGNAQEGVVISSANAHRNTLENNFIGVGADGVSDLGNGGDGVWMGSDASNNVLVWNVISGNGGNGVTLQGSGNNDLLENNIGTDDTGTVDVGNALHGVLVLNASNNEVGGAGFGNLISGNDSIGVLIRGITASNNLVQDNIIGLDVFGNPLGNTGSGVAILEDAFFNTVGGTVTGTRNIISSNGGRGVWIWDATQNQVEGNYIGTDLAGTAARPNAGPGVLIDDASQNTVGGLGDLGRNVISGNGGNGITITGTAGKNNVVRNNYIGLDATGGNALANNSYGVYITGGASLNTVGGTTTGVRNVISGYVAGVRIESASQNKVEGNYIGTDATGMVEKGNGVGVFLYDASQNTIGGLGDLGRNVISGNSEDGIRITGSASTNNKVQNNYIGTDKDGTGQVANGLRGIFLYHAQSNTIGGTTAGERNVISGNGTRAANGDEGHGIAIQGGDFNVIQGNYIGTKVNGTEKLGNSKSGVYLSLQADNNTIGGTDASARNVISANGQYGIYVHDGTANSIDFNYVGVNKDGMQDEDLKNKDGWRLDEDVGNTWGANNIHQDE